MECDSVCQGMSSGYLKLEESYGLTDATASMLLECEEEVLGHPQYVRVDKLS